VDDVFGEGFESFLIGWQFIPLLEHIVVQSSLENDGVEFGKDLLCSVWLFTVGCIVTASFDSCHDSLERSQGIPLLVECPVVLNEISGCDFPIQCEQVIQKIVHDVESTEFVLEVNNEICFSTALSICFRNAFVMLSYSFHFCRSSLCMRRWLAIVAAVPMMAAGRYPGKTGATNGTLLGAVEVRYFGPDISAPKYP
jgi:hypothetical protein